MPSLRCPVSLAATAVAGLLFAACGTDRGDPLDVDGDAAAGFEIPVGDDLQAWLVDRAYEDLPAESEIHPSSGPHGRVRTFVSQGLSDSLAAGGDHPVGVGAVKELYDGDELSGWAVSVKVAEDSAGGDGWYWFEVFDTSADATPEVNGTGAGGCTGCHGGGRDFVQLPFPLQ